MNFTELRIGLASAWVFQWHLPLTPAHMAWLGQDKCRNITEDWMRIKLATNDAAIRVAKEKAEKDSAEAKADVIHATGGLRWREPRRQEESR